MKKLRYLALLLVAAFAFSGCKVITINPDRDGAQVVAEVNGEKITKKQVYDAAGLTWDVKADGYTAANRNTMKSQALDSLIQDIVIKAKVKELGYDKLNADEEKEIADSLKTYRDNYYESILSSYQEKAKTDPSIKPEEKAEADIKDYEQQLKDNKALQKAKDAVGKDLAATADEVQKMYSDILSTEKSAFDSDPSYISVYEMYYGYPIVYYPQDGYVRVKQILIKIPDDAQKEISTMREGNLTEEANKKRDEELKKIEAKAGEVLTKVKAAGGDLTKLNALITENNEDPGMTAESAGYLVYKDSKDYVQEFTNAAMALKDIGKPSELVATDYGYHILWLSEKITKGEVPLEKVKDKVTELATTSKQNEAWTTAVTEWVDALKKDKKIQTYTGRLNNN